MSEPMGPGERAVEIIADAYRRMYPGSNVLAVEKDELFHAVREGIERDRAPRPTAVQRDPAPPDATVPPEETLLKQEAILDDLMRANEQIAAEVATLRARLAAAERERDRLHQALTDAGFDCPGCLDGSTHDITDWSCVHGPNNRYALAKEAQTAERREREVRAAYARVWGALRRCVVALMLVKRGGPYSPAETTEISASLADAESALSGLPTPEGT